MKIYLSFHISDSFPSLILHFYSGKPTTLCEIMGKADMWLFRSYWDFEFPQPYLPNTEFVRGLHCKPAKPLPKVVKCVYYCPTWMKREVLVTQLYLTLCDPMDCSLSGSSVHGICWERILKWVAIPFSRGSSQPRDQNPSLTLQANSLPSEPPGKLKYNCIDYLFKCSCCIFYQFSTGWN